METPRRAIVEARLGPSAGKRAILHPGETLVVGRDEGCGLVLSGDARVSARHLALTWRDGVCTMRDLRSGTGTLLGGEPAAEGVVAHGDYLQAGGNFLMVYHERATPPPLGAPSLPDDEVDRITAELRSRGPLYAVLDPTRGLRVLQLLRESVDPMGSLYSGVAGLRLEDAAPHLVKITEGSDLLSRLVAEGWTRRWGVFLVSRRPFRAVRAHLKKYLMVTDDATEERLYFRFYDPRVLAGFHRSMTPHQAATFFEDIRAFAIEGEGGRVAWLTREGARREAPGAGPAEIGPGGGT